MWVGERTIKLALCLGVDWECMPSRPPQKISPIKGSNIFLAGCIYLYIHTYIYLIATNSPRFQMRSHHQEMCCRPCCSRSPLRGPGPFAHSHPVLAKTTPWKIHREPQDFCSNHSSRSPTPHPHRRLSVQVGAGRDEDLEAVQLLLHGRPN